MGNYIIKIHGIGPHHNDPQRSDDADYLAARLVQGLRELGHEIDSASIQITDPQYRGGEKESLLPEDESAQKIVYPMVDRGDGTAHTIIETDSID
jgi:hypothetical protein